MSETYRIFIEQFTGLLTIGIHDFEKKSPQRYMVDVSIEVKSPDVWSDDIKNYFDYDALYGGIKELYQHAYLTQEFFARKVLELCLAHDEVVRAEVVVKKPDVYPEAAGVGIRLVGGG